MLELEWFFGNEERIMSEIFMGVVSGIIGGLGMGGGTILILLLSLFFGVEQHVAQSTNVIFFIPTAIASIIVNLRNKNINLKQGLPICLWGIVGAFFGANISMKMQVQELRKWFGLFLILIAFYQMREYIKEKKRHNSNK